ncbi:MAG: hypothetical protein C4524_11050 [Candidatus Zixiibacteriota bacterium]|nr:MAG: hypothetical protein C4524_11050 [candidate division Zixibacteria bacterium]
MNADSALDIDSQGSGRKSRGDFRVLFHRILQYAHRGATRIEFLREVSSLLLDFSSADAAELRLLERNQHFRGVAMRGAVPRVQFEILPLAHTESGDWAPSAGPVSELEHLVWAVIHGRIDSASPHFTHFGSFITGDPLETVKIPGTDGGPASGRLVSLAGPYASLLLIPIAVENHNVGLMMLKSPERDFFPREEVSFYESLAQNIGVALAHRRAQVALRERVKELTCLYGIARLVEQPGITLEQLMQGVVDLLPPAWLYPEIAYGRITVNGSTFVTRGFREGPHRQTAEVVVGGVRRGAVEVHYVEARPSLDEGPYLKEERSLIDTIAREVALIIERRQAEDESARLQEQLRHADRLATIGQLAAGVAHELNEPLGNILGFAQLARKLPQVPAEVDGDLEKIVNASLYAREVIRKLMLFARQAPSRRDRVSLNDVIQDSLALLEGRLNKSAVEVNLQLAPDLPPVTADPSQLGQVLINLAVNALQAMPGGGWLGITTWHEGDNVFLEVEDTGCGMSDQVMAQIFIPFFTTKDVNQGTGLGLSVVHGIVTGHGGNITVRSETGRGSRFTVRLPVNRSPDREGSDNDAIIA